MEKYQNIDTHIREYYKIYNKEKTSDALKLRILEKIFELEHYQLRIQQDFPYLETHHKDVMDELATLEADIKEIEEKITETQKPTRLINPIFTTNDPNRIPIDSIKKNKEIQDIRMSRIHSGFEGRISKNEFIE